MKQCVLLMVFVFLTSSCIYKTMVNFDEDDLLWLSSCVAGDSILFTCNTAAMHDTLMVVGHNISNAKIPIHCQLDIDDLEHFYAHGGLVLRSCNPHSRYKINGNLICTKWSKDSLNVYISLNNFTCNREFLDTLETCTIDGIEYSDCLVLNLDDKDCYQLGYNRRDSTKNFSVTGLVWSRSKGLLQYTVDSTYTFTRTP